MASSSMANLLSVPLRAGRKRSGSFSEVRSIARSLSTERPGTPRPTDLEASGHCGDSRTADFKKPASLRESRFFGSMDSINTKSSSNHHSSLSREVLRSAFVGFTPDHKTVAAAGTGTSEAQALRALAQLTDLSDKELMKMDFYSDYRPTSVTLSHFLDHASGGTSVEDSFVFLRREIPVRIANIMKELEVSPCDVFVIYGSNESYFRYCPQNCTLSPYVGRSSATMARASRRCSSSTTRRTMKRTTLSSMKFSPTSDGDTR